MIQLIGFTDAERAIIYSAVAADLEFIPASFGLHVVEAIVLLQGMTKK